MKSLEKILFGMLFAFLVSLNFISCGSTKVDSANVVNQAELTKENSRMFWKISGTDANGNPSAVYVLGTIHVGNEKLYPLDENVINSFVAADRLYAELSYDDIAANLQTEIIKQMSQSLLENGKSLLSDLTETQQKTLAANIDGQVLTGLSIMKPWCLKSVLETSYLQNLGFQPNYGLDVNLYALAANVGKTVAGLDALQTQIDVVTFGDYNVQIQMLRDMLDDLESDTASTQIADLYAAYLDGDVNHFEKLVEESYKNDEKRHVFYKDYYKKLIDDRNNNWAKQITGFLNEGGTTFIFAGSAHFVGGKSVFNIMRKQGTLKK